MKITVNWNLCDGNGMCVAQAPDFFDLDDDDALVVLREKLGEDDRPRVDAAVRSCPKGALAVAE